jgi:hypothetical protein
VKDAAPLLLEQLEQQPPNVPGTIRSLHPAVRSLSFEPDPAGGWAAVATVSDGQQNYVLAIQFTRPLSGHHARWLAIGVRS